MFDGYLRRSETTAYRTIDGVAMIVGGEGKLFTLNEVGTFIWEQADGRRTLAEIVRQICDKFEVDDARAKQEAEAFVLELKEKNLLALVTTPVA